MKKTFYLAIVLFLKNEQLFLSSRKVGNDSAVLALSLEGQRVACELLVGCLQVARELPASHLRVTCELPTSCLRVACSELVASWLRVGFKLAGVDNARHCYPETA